MPPSTSSAVLFFTQLEEQLKSAEAACRLNDMEQVVHVFDSIFSSLRSSSRPVHIQDLLAVQRSFFRCLPPRNLPLDFLHLLIDHTLQLAPIFADVRRHNLPVTIDTVNSFMAASARLRSLEDIMRTLAWLRDDCRHIAVGLDEYNTWLGLFARGGDLQGAMILYDDMVRRGLQANDVTFQHLLFACGKAEMLSMGLSLLEHISSTAATAATAQPQPQAETETKAETDSIPTPEAGDSKAPTSIFSPPVFPTSAAAASLPPFLSPVSAPAAPAAPAAAGSFPVSPSLFEHLISGLLSISVASSFNKLEAALSVLKLMRTYAASGLTAAPTLRVYSSLIAAYRRGHDLRRAYELYIEMRRDGLLLPTEDFNLLLLAMGKGDDGVRQALGMMKERVEAWRLGGGQAVDVSSFNSLLDLCRQLQRERKEVVQAVLELMQQLGVQRDAATYSRLIDLHAAEGQLVQALAVYHQLLASGLQPDVLTFNNLIAAAGDDHWLVWCALLDLSRARVAPTDKTMMLAMQAAERKDSSGAWLLPFFNLINNALLAAENRTADDAQPALTAASSAVPHGLEHRARAAGTESAPLFPPAELWPAAARHSSSLSKFVYGKVLEVLSKTGPHPLSVVESFLSRMREAGHELMRQQLKDLLLARADRDELDGVIALMRTMLAEGLQVDADVVFSLMRKLEKLPDFEARAAAYVQEIDRQLVQTERVPERRHQLLQGLFQGLCSSRLFSLALDVLQLTSEREGVRVTSKQMSELVSALPRDSASYVSEAVQLYARMRSFGLQPTVVLYTNLTPDTKTVEDVLLLESAVSGLGLQRDAPYCFAVLFRLLSFVLNDPRVGDCVDSLLRQMEAERVLLDASDLQGLLSMARMKKSVRVGRALWRYMLSTRMDIKGRWLHLCTTLAALKQDGLWLQDIYRYLHHTALGGDKGPPLSSSTLAQQAGWKSVYEELLAAQARVPPPHNLTFRIWLDMRQAGREDWLHDHGRLYDAMLAAVKARVAAAFTAEESLQVQQIVSRVSTGRARPLVLTEPMVELLTAGLQAYRQKRREQLKGSQTDRPRPESLAAINGGSAQHGSSAARRQRLNGSTPVNGARANGSTAAAAGAHRPHHKQHRPPQQNRGKLPDATAAAAAPSPQPAHATATAK